MRQKRAYRDLLDTIARFNNGWKPDWNNDEETKECFIFSHGGYGVGIEINNSTETQLVDTWLYMKSGVADKVKEELGEEKIKLALWGMEA